MSSFISYPTNSDDIINVIIHEIMKRTHPIIKMRLQQGRAMSNGSAVSGVKSTEDSLKHEIEQDYSEVLTAFIVRASIVDPRNNFDIEKDFTRQDVERLIQLSVDFLTRKDLPSLETIRMQIAFDTSLPIQADHLRKEKASKISLLAPLLREILECQSKKLTTVEDLYRKVVTYVIIKSELGDPLDINVVKEATAALESTFPNSEVNVFISLPRKEKESQLIGLTQLVTGIRLFNSELGKGGDGIPKVPKQCEDEIALAKNQISELVAKLSDDIDFYTAAIKLILSKKTEDNTKLPDEEASMLNRLKDGLIFSYQFQSYLKIFEENRINSDKVLASNMIKFRDCLRELKNTCKSKTAVPVDHVYPQFMLLSTCWNTLKDELFFLEFRRDLLARLIKYSKNFTIEVTPELRSAVGTNYKGSSSFSRLSDVEIIGKSADLMSTVGLYTKKIEVLHPGNSSMYYRLKSEFSGFCPFQLVANENFLLPGDKNIGLLRYKDQLFSFSSFESAVEFSKDPESVIQRVIENACLNPQLVHLLFLHKYFPTFAALEGVRSFSKQKLLGKVTVTYDAMTQTDTHIVDTYIDKNYEWNEWELRRKALMLVNLRHKATHSTQTNKSHFRRETETQHYAQKHEDTQTVTDSSTMVPKKVNFLHGLRHASTHPTKLKVVDLTLDLPSLG